MADPARTEEATPRRRQEARKRGQVARSNEVTAALILLAVLLFFRFFGADLMAALSGEARHWWGGLRGGEVTAEGVQAAGGSLIIRLLVMLAPLFLLLIVTGLVSNIAQFGVLFTSEPLTPKLEHLSPAQGFKRIFSMRTGVDAFKAVLKVTIVGWVAWSVLTSSFREVQYQSLQPLGASVAQSAGLAWSLGIKVVLALFALAILDYLYQRWEFSRSLRMTKQEVRDEHRQMEGDPMVKARIRQLMREATRRRMIAEVPRADVVITNPMHLAVAIRYDPGKSRAPQVVAKGARLLAERIKGIARESRVPIYQDALLAQSLFAVPVNGELPYTLYHAVAQVLAFVYHTNHRDKAREAMRDVSARGLKVAVHGH